MASAVDQPPRGGPLERLRALALSLERLAAEGLASGALRGAAGELRAGVPDVLDERGRRLLEDGLTLLERLVHSGVEATASPEGWGRAAAREVLRGSLEEFRRLVPEAQPTTRELLLRIRSWLEESAAEAAARAQESRAPGDRARVMAAGALAGAIAELRTGLPELAGPAAYLAEEVGRGLMRGLSEELGQRARRLTHSPPFLGALAGAALLGLLVATRRR